MDTKVGAAPPAAVVMLTIAEATAEAGISKRYMEMRIAAGTGPDITRIGRRVLIRADRLHAWIDQLTTEPEAQMGRDPQTDAALRVLSAVKARHDGDSETALKTLRGSPSNLSVRLMEAVELIHHLLRGTGDLEGALVELIDTVQRAAER
jgi:hypothetical protein